MPNHITNIITFDASEELVEAVLAKFSTNNPATPKYSFGGDLTFCNDLGEYGWLNTETGWFKRRKHPETMGVPEGFKPALNESFVRFPDFAKVFEKPAIYDEIGEVSMNLETHAKIRANANFDTCPIIAGLDKMSRKRSEKEELSDKDSAIVDLMVKAYQEHGAFYWYDWQRSNWGTKWNSYSCKRLGWKRFQFETAWSCAHMITDEIHKQFPDVPFKLEFASEDTGYNCGILTYSNGSRNDYQPEGGSVAAYDLALKLNPEMKQYYQLVDGKYQHIEEE